MAEGNANAGQGNQAAAPQGQAAQGGNGANGPRTYTQEEANALVEQAVRARVDRQNATHRKEVDDLRAQLDEAKKASEDAAAEVAGLKAAAERAKAVREAAKAAGVDADVLGRMSGETAEEIEANAKLLAEAMGAKPLYPQTGDKGQQAAPPASIESIRKSIKDPAARVREMARHPELLK